MSESTLVQVVADLSKKMKAPPSASDIAAALNLSDRRVRQLAAPLIATGQLVRIGIGPATRLAVPESGLRERLEQLVEQARQAGALDILADLIQRAGVAS